MAINFPSNPNTNDTYSYGDKSWIFNGVAWEINNNGNIGNIAVTGNITAGNILTDNYFYANGDPFVSSNYGDSDVGDYLTTYTGNITAGNISVTGAIDGYATTTYVDSEVANLVASAPATLDTLNELAAALGNDPNLSTTLTSLIGNNSANIITLQGNVTTLESDISNLEANIPANLQSNVTTLESDVSTLQGNITVLDNQVANLNYYDDTNVTTFLSDIGSNAITTTGDITANSFIGDGSQLTGLPAGYTDSNVETVLSGNITVGNISVTGTIDGYATTSYVDSEVANLVASAPSTLDTLNELAAALGNDPNLSTTLTSLIGNNSANITTLQGNITSIESDITNLEANIPADLQSNVTTLEGNIVSIESDITTLQSNITSIESDITNLEANIPADLQSNVTTLESDVSALQGNVVTLDNQIANLNYYDDTNVTTLLSDIGSNAITTTGDITANSFIGDGSQLTGLPASYSDSNVASYLPTYTGNITAGNILTDNYFYANGEAFVSGGGGNSLTLANSAPSSPSNGDIWVDSDTGREYTYINDGDSSQWVELKTSSTDIGTNKTSSPIFNFPTTINSNLTIESGNNGLSVGPISQAANTVISINAGQRWIIL